MSKRFDDLMRRITSQMKVMLEERRRFDVLANELRAFTKGRRDYESKQVRENNSQAETMRSLSI